MKSWINFSFTASFSNEWSEPGKRLVFGRPRSVEIGCRIEQFGGRATAMFESLLVPIVARFDDAVVARPVNERIHPGIGADDGR